MEPRATHTQWVLYCSLSLYVLMYTLLIAIVCLGDFMLHYMSDKFLTSVGYNPSCLTTLASLQLQVKCGVQV